MEPRLLALDFDGVLCDSALETATTAWYAGRHLWGQGHIEEPSQELLQRFCRLRPGLETGYEAIPLMRVALQQLPEEDVLANPRQYIDGAIEELGCSPHELQRLFSQTRDRWIEEDNESWLSKHRFYPGVCDALNAALQNDYVYILTTKQERFVQILLEQHGVQFPASFIYGLERREAKEDTLTRLVGEYSSAADFLFVEDRLPTLERTLQYPQLAGIWMYLAAWGYNTSAAQERAATLSGTEVLELDEFVSLLTRGR